MHASIAHALYRGERRQFQTRKEIADARFERLNCRYGRGPWLRAALDFVQSYPTFSPIATFREGAKKREVVCVVGYLHPAVVKNADGWCATSLNLLAKTCTLDQRDLPIKVAHHTVLRLMQRADIDQVAQALVWTLPALLHVLLVEPTPGGGNLLLPCVTGAVVAVQDRDMPDHWAFVTFIDNDKLRPEQRAEIEDRKRRIKEELGAYGMHETSGGQHGGRAFLA